MTYNITDPVIIRDIDMTREREGSVEVLSYLYKLIIDEFGIVEFLSQIGFFIAKERQAGYDAGIKRTQDDLQKVLGIFEKLS